MKDIEGFVENKQVFVGIDVPKKRWVVYSLCDGEVLEKVSLSGNCDSLSNFLAKGKSARGIKWYMSQDLSAPIYISLSNGQPSG